MRFALARVCAALLPCIWVGLGGCAKQTSRGVVPEPATPAQAVQQPVWQNVRYTCLSKGLPVFDRPEAGAAQTALLPLGTMVNELEIRSAPADTLDQSWSSVEWKDGRGWTQSYYLSEFPPSALSLTEAPTSVEGYWVGYVSDHLTDFWFLENGEANVSYCEASYEYWWTHDQLWQRNYRYTWGQNEETVTMFETYDAIVEPLPGDEDLQDTVVTEARYAWRREDVGEFHVAGDLELFRRSNIQSAVERGDTRLMYILTENNTYTARDLDHALYTVESYQGRAAQTWTTPAGEQITCRHPSAEASWDMPLVGIALSQDPPNLQAARLLIRYGASVDATVRNMSSSVREPMIFHFRRDRNTAAYEFLVANGARVDGKDSEGHTLYDLVDHRDGPIRHVVPQEGLELRETPEADGDVAALIPCDDGVTVIEEYGGETTLLGTTGKWTLVKWDDAIGWVFGGLLR